MELQIYSAIYVGCSILFTATLVYFGFRFAIPFHSYQGTRLITCPETKDYAAVKVKAGQAGLTSLFGEKILELKDCSRWPLREDCPQWCLKQIEQAPEDCQLRTIVEHWYEGKSCALCQTPVSAADTFTQMPALRNAEGKTFEWQDVAPERLPHVLDVSEPVCWNCHVTETFRRTYPELIVMRPFHETHA
jgi:hypothetical protein